MRAIVGEGASAPLAERVWALSDGMRGNVVQARALAELSGLPFDEATVSLAAPWRWVAPRLGDRVPATAIKSTLPLHPPFPRLVIGCSRRAGSVVRAIKAWSGGRTKAVQILDPSASRSRFDLIIAPRHDGVSGNHVVSTIGSVCPIHPGALADARERWRSALGRLPAPRVAVLVGGNSRRHRLTAAGVDRIAGDLKVLAAAAGASLMVSVSRRTPKVEANRLRTALGTAAGHFYDDEGDNPYLGYLAWADHVLVTEDSVNMTTEAIATGRPVQTIALDGDSQRFVRFHDHLRGLGYTKPFAGTLEHWQPPPYEDRARLSRAIKGLIHPG